MDEKYYLKLLSQHASGRICTREWVPAFHRYRLTDSFVCCDFTALLPHRLSSVVSFFFLFFLFSTFFCFCYGFCFVFFFVFVWFCMFWVVEIRVCFLFFSCMFVVCCVSVSLVCFLVGLSYRSALLSF